MVQIPAGDFILGFDSSLEIKPFISENTTGINAQPKQTILLETFFIKESMGLFLLALTIGFSFCYKCPQRRKRREAQ